MEEYTIQISNEQAQAILELFAPTKPAVEEHTIQISNEQAQAILELFTPTKPVITGIKSTVKKHDMFLEYDLASIIQTEPMVVVARRRCDISSDAKCILLDRVSQKKAHYGFPDHGAAFNMIKSMEISPFDEVVGDRHKIFFDLEKLDHPIELIVKVVAGIIEDYTVNELNLNMFIIFDLCREQRKSFHVIVASIAANWQENKYLAVKLSERLRDLPYAMDETSVDLSVYKANSNLRAPLSCKIDSAGNVLSRKDRCFNGNLRKINPSVDCFVSYTRFCQRLELIEEEDYTLGEVRSADFDLSATSGCIPADVLGGILSNTAEYIRGFDFPRVIDGRPFVVWRRTQATYCTLCQRLHEKDNTLYAVWDGSVVWYKCRKAAPGLSYAHHIVYNKKKQNKSGALLRALSRRKFIPVPSNCELSPDLFNRDSRVIALRCPMGRGKTKALIEWICKNNIDSLLVLTNRLTMTDDLLNRYRSRGIDLKDYRAVKGALDCKKLICQMESSHRIPADVKFSVVIMDEVDHLFKQILSRTMDSRRDETWNRLSKLTSSADKIIAMDAYCSQWHLDCLRHVIDDSAVKCELLVDSRPANPGREFLYTAEKQKMHAELKKDLSSGKNCIYVTSRGPDQINAICELARGILVESSREPSVYGYSSRSDRATIVAHFADVNKVWTKYSFIAYTPSLTAGVSFEQKHFDTMYIDCDSSTISPQTLCQMIGRVRDINRYVFLYRGAIVKSATEIDIVNEITDRINIVARELDFRSDLINFQKCGDKYSIEKTPFAEFYIGWRVREQTMRANFAENVIRSVQEFNWRLYELRTEDEATDYNGEINALMRGSKEEELRKIADATLIDEREAYKLMDAPVVDENSRVSLIKYNLSRLYRLPENYKFTVSWLKRALAPAAMRAQRLYTADSYSLKCTDCYKLSLPDNISQRYDAGKKEYVDHIHSLLGGKKVFTGQEIEKFKSDFLAYRPDFRESMFGSAGKHCMKFINTHILPCNGVKLRSTNNKKTKWVLESTV